MLECQLLLQEEQDKPTQAWDQESKQQERDLSTMLEGAEVVKAQKTQRDTFELRS